MIHHDIQSAWLTSVIRVEMTRAIDSMLLPFPRVVFGGYSQPLGL